MEKRSEMRKFASPTTSMFCLVFLINYQNGLMRYNLWSNSKGLATKLFVIGTKNSQRCESHEAYLYTPKLIFLLFQNSDNLLQPLFSDGDNDALKEIQVYFHDSFGNSTRIDYGTGHEMAFVMFLACLFHIRVLHINQDVAATGLLVFSKYMELVRKLQATYRMEPAGSQGVRLNKMILLAFRYQFVIYILGMVFGRFPIRQFHLGCCTIYEWA